MSIRSLAMVVLLLCATVAGANILVNPGFEDGITNTSWKYSGSALITNSPSRTGNWGFLFRGSATPTRGCVTQQVAATSGTYTFAVWARESTNFSASSLDLQIEWLNASTVSIQTATINSYIGVLPKDAQWHQIFVTGTCTSNDLAFVRVSVNSAWSSVANSGLNIDDIDLYSGAYAGSTLANGGFERDCWDKWNWGRAQWNGNPTNLIYGQGGGLLGDNLSAGCHSGTGGVAFYSNITNQPNYTCRFWQNMNPTNGTGVYTYAVWLRKGLYALSSNATMQIEWYDNTFTNKVQTDSVSNLVLTNNNDTWVEYYVQGTCTSPALYEARAVFSIDWSRNTNVVDGRSTFVDDARFMPLPYNELANGLKADWCYHNSAGHNARTELVPGTNVGPFLQVSYGTTSVTFYVLGDSPSQARFYPDQDSRFKIKTTWPIPGTRGGDGEYTWTTNYSDMTRLGDVVISSSQPFHGLPTSGAKTVSVWKLVWPMPTNSLGLPDTSNIPIYYTPMMKSTNVIGGADTSPTEYLVAWNASIGALESSNNLGQYIGEWQWVEKLPDNREYFFDLNPQRLSTLNNGGFEDPSVEIGLGWDFTGTSWSSPYRTKTSREQEAKHSGDFGVLFMAWDFYTGAVNPGHSFVYQDISVTGGMYAFSTWIKIGAGANPRLNTLSMQWFDKDGRLVQENQKDLLYLPKDMEWHKVFVAGGCAQTNLDYVRVGIETFNGPQSGASDRYLHIDDAAFAALPSGLANPGFEIGTGIENSYDDLVDWSSEFGYIRGNIESEPHNGTNQFVFPGWLANAPRYESFLTQPIAASTGQYALSVWIRREANFPLTNAQLMIQWYDGSLSNKVQADTAADLVIPNDGAWYSYAVTGTCDSVNLRAIIPGLFVQWDAPVGDGNPMLADDFSLVWSGGGGECFVDGVPCWWWIHYGITNSAGGIDLSRAVATNDLDSDGYINLEEYAGDTDPTNSASYFPKVFTAPSSDKSTTLLVIGPSSSNRCYDVFWKTNLMDNSEWQAFGMSATGSSPLTLTVTNGPEALKYFRTQAKPIPGVL